VYFVVKRFYQEEAIQLAFKSTPKADVTILPSGGTIIPCIQ
jgi:hypothetical protein